MTQTEVQVGLSFEDGQFVMTLGPTSGPGANTYGKQKLSAYEASIVQRDIQEAVAAIAELTEGLHVPCTENDDRGGCAAFMSDADAAELFGVPDGD